MKLPLIPIAKALKIDRLIRQNVYAYQFFGVYLSRFSFLLPHEPEFHAFRILPSRHGLFLDIGANDGISARSFRVFDKVTPIISIEANPSHESQLKATKAKLNLFDYKLMAAGEASGRLVLHTPVFKGIALTAYASIDRKEAESRVHFHMPNSIGRLTFMETEVPVVPIDNLALTPDFVKIDVEGFEVQVLRGMFETIKRCSPTFLVEYHPGNTADIVETLKPFGYKPCLYDRYTDEFRFYAHDAPLAGSEAYAGDNIFYFPPSLQEVLPGLKYAAKD